MADFIRVPPDSTGKMILTKQHDIDGEAIQVQAVEIVGGNNPKQSQYIDSRGSAFVRFSEGQPALDSFARLKTTHSNIVGVYEYTNSDYGDLFTDILTGSATSVFDKDKASVVLSTDTNSISSVYKTTNRHHYYQNGNSFIVGISISCGDAGKENNTRRWGYYSKENGFFFELQDNELFLCSRSDISGSVVDSIVSQAEWNGDRCDGTGLSKYNIDVTKIQQYWINFSFPTGMTRFGVYDTGGNRVVCHTVRHSGNSPFSITRTPSLPITFENVNTGMTNSSTELRIFGAVISSEGNTNYTFWRSSSIGCVGKSVVNNTPLFTIKSKIQNLSTGRVNHIQSYPENLSVISSGGSIKVDLYWHNTKDGLLTGANYLIDSGSTTIVDNSASALNIEETEKFITFYCGAGVTNIDLRPYFELNDEGICIVGDDINSSALTFVATKLDGTSVNVTADISTRELW